MQARTKPRKVEPVSPIKIFAGLKLYGKNPNPAPARAAAIIATLRFLETIVSDKSVTDAIDETPTASPSRPSIRLTAFVTPTIHMTVSGIDHIPRLIYGAPNHLENGFATYSISTPKYTTTKAAII